MPQPDGPSSRDELARLHLQRDAANHRGWAVCRTSLLQAERRTWCGDRMGGASRLAYRRVLTLNRPGCRVPFEPYPYPRVGSASPEIRRDARYAVRHRSRPTVTSRRYIPARMATTSPSCAATARASPSSSCPAMAADSRSPRSPSTRSKNRTGDHWHVLVHGLPHDVLLRLARRRPARAGHRFDPDRLLLDPACAAALRAAPSGPARARPIPQRTARRSLFYRGRRYDWEDDAPPLIPLEDTHHLRAARPRLHLPPVVRRSRTPARSPG